MNGKYIQYLVNGLLNSEDEYKDGRLNGISFYYNGYKYDGELFKIKEYLSGY